MHSPLTVRQTVLTAIAVILLGAGVAMAQEHCNVPDEINLTKFTVSAQQETEAVHLEPINAATRIRWTIGILVPDLVRDEVGIHLYSPSEIGVSQINSNAIIPFIVCRDPENQAYWARRATISERRATISPSNNNENNTPTDNLFLGSTVPIPVKQKTTPTLLQGNLRAFSPSAQSNTTGQQLQ